MLRMVTGKDDAGLIVSARENMTAAELVNARVSTEQEETGPAVKETEKGVVVEITENLKEMYQQQAEAAREAAKEAAESAEELAKILEIARRISRGDKVPASDEQKLAQYDADLYQMAKSSALLHAKEKHKRYKTLFEEESGEDMETKLRDLKRERAKTDRSETSCSLAQKQLDFSE